MQVEACVFWSITEILLQLQALDHHSGLRLLPLKLALIKLGVEIRSAPGKLAHTQTVGAVFLVQFTGLTAVDWPQFTAVFQEIFHPVILVAVSIDRFLHNRRVRQVVTFTDDALCPFDNPFQDVGTSVLEQESSSISPYLATLSELGFVVKDTPITEKNPEHSRKGLYFVSDNFTRFWFRYVYPYKGELELDNQQIVLDELQKTFISSFVAFAYEDVCKNIQNRAKQLVQER